MARGGLVPVIPRPIVCETRRLRGVRRISDRNEKLIEAGLVLASELSLSPVLQRIVELAAEITKARYGALGVLGPEGGISEFLTVGVSDEERRAIGDPPRGEGLLGAVIREGLPIRIREIASDPRSSGFPHNHPAMHSFLGVPINARGKVFGNIYLTDKRDAAEFSDEDQRDVEILATQAGVAVENARIYEQLAEAQDQLRRLAVMEDRERIAKDLHDGAIQALFAVGMGLQGSAALSRDEEIARRIESATDDIDRVIRDLRNYIFGLRPGVLADRQLAQALEEIARDFERQTGVVTAVEIDPAVAAELGSGAGDVVQLTREALSNVGRHADAATCRLSLRREGDTALLEIDDDGSGFDVETAMGTGNGLSNLEDRADSLGGKATIDSSPADGTTVRIRIPL